MRSPTYWLLVLFAALLSVTTAAQAALLDEHFGVTPEVQLIENWEYAPGQFYTGYQFVESSLAPTLNTGTVDYQVDDWFGQWSPTELGPSTDYPGTGAYPSGDEPYDTEAYYFDDDSENIYITIIVGFPSPEDGIFQESRYGDLPVTQGDFALDVPGGTGQTDSWGFQYDYGVDLTDEINPGDGTNVTEFASNTLGGGVYQTDTGWYLGTPDGAVNPVTGDESNAYTNFDPSYSGLSPLGSATVSWYELDIPYGANPDVLENNWETYVIEITIPRDLLLTLRPGDVLQFHWLMGCRNDGSEASAFLTGSGDIDSPEPGTMALLLLGLGPAGVWLRKRRSRDS